jgi:hypothetical protein
LLRSFDRIGAHPLKVDARHLAVPGEYGTQVRGPHLDRFLHHVIEPRRFKRCEQIMQIACSGLGPDASADAQHRIALAAFELSTPFAIAAVEHEDAIAGFQPQHGREVMRLAALKRGDTALFER